MCDDICICLCADKHIQVCIREYGGQRATLTVDPYVPSTLYLRQYLIGLESQSRLDWLAIGPYRSDCLCFLSSHGLKACYYA